MYTERTHTKRLLYYTPHIKYLKTFELLCVTFVMINIVHNIMTREKRSYALNSNNMKRQLSFTSPQLGNYSTIHTILFQFICPD